MQSRNTQFQGKFHNTTQSIVENNKGKQMSIFESMSFDHQPNNDVRSSLNKSLEDSRSIN